MARKHKVDEVIKSLSQKRDCRINVKDQIVEILSPGQHQDLGNGSWGKIDYLCNHKGYTRLFVREFSQI